MQKNRFEGRAQIFNFHVDMRMGILEDPEYFIDKSLSDGFDACKIKCYFFELIKPVQQSLCL